MEAESASGASVHSLLARAAQLSPERPAVLHGTTVLTWREVEARALALARALGRLTKRGDSVATVLGLSPVALDYLFAAAAMGSPLVPLNTRWTVHEQLEALADSGARVLATDSRELARAVAHAAARGRLSVVVLVTLGAAAAEGAAAESARGAALRCVSHDALPSAAHAPRAQPPPPPDGPEASGVPGDNARALRAGSGAPGSGAEPYPLRAGSGAPGSAAEPCELRPGSGAELCQLVFTSGTTGGPKGVALSHAAVVAQAVQKAVVLRYSQNTRQLAAAPLFHVAGLSAVHAVTAAGGAHVLPRSTAGAAMLEAVRARGVTDLVVVPAMLHALLLHEIASSPAERPSAPSVRTVFVGGGTPSPALMRAAVRAFAPRARFVLSYACTEAGSTMCTRELRGVGDGDLGARGSDARDGGGGGDRDLAAAAASADCDLRGWADRDLGGVDVGTPLPLVEVALLPPRGAPDGHPAGARPPPSEGRHAAAGAVALARPGYGAAAGTNAGAARPTHSAVAPTPHSRPGEIGEIVTRGPHLMAGYWRRPEASAAALEGGWLRTGDLGYFATAPGRGAPARGGGAARRAAAAPDHRGAAVGADAPVPGGEEVRQDETVRLVLLGRGSDAFKSGGELVHASEVEAALREHPAVADAAVTAVPDDRLGDKVVAVVVLARADAPATATVAQLLAHCRARLARYKVPRELLAWPAERLPRTASGKVIKPRLREAVLAELGAAAAAPRARL